MRFRTRVGEAIADEVATAVQETVEFLASGACESFEDYRRKCGRVAAFRETLHLIQAAGDQVR